ncbi:hypothetical protein DXG01_011884 [Tephrocybe rancida]|nr:hypothetical protein DXG01_011884 [Tephrocybe rancida]
MHDSDDSTPVLHRDFDDDPAFSSDPHAHPFHIPWSLKPDDDARLLQLPNLPMFSDDHSSTTHETSSSSNHTSTTRSTPPTSADSHEASWAPSPPHLRWPPEVQKKKKNIAMFWRRTPPETVLASVDIARNVSPDPSPPPRNMTPTPRPAPTRIVTAPEVVVSKERPRLPPRSATATADFKPPPPAARRIAGVLGLRGSELDRIDELDESNPAGLPLHHDGPYEAAHKPEVSEPKVPHNIGSQWQIPAHKPPKQSRKHDRKQEPNPQQHRRHVSEVTSVPIVPAGVSLNLSPGQVLPHNFYYQINQNMIPAAAPVNAPGWPPQPQQQPQPRYQPQPRNHGQPEPQSHTRSHSHPEPQSYPRNHGQPASQPYLAFHQNSHHATHDQRQPEQPPAVYESKQARLDGKKPSSRHRNAPPEYSILPADHYVSKGDTKKVPVYVTPPYPDYEGEKKLAYDILHLQGDQKRSSQLKAKEKQLYPGPPVNIQPDFRINTPAPRHHQTSNRLPPRMQALQMQVPRSDEKHRRSPRPPNGGSEFIAPPGAAGAAQPGHRIRRSHTPQMVDHNQQVPLFIDNNGFPASAPAPPSFDIIQGVQDPIQPGAVSQPPQGPPSRSLHSSSKSTNSGTPRGGPPPNHLPKHLVMPAPLQGSQPLAPRHQQQPTFRPEDQSWQPHLRSASPPIGPQALDPYIESQIRAEDKQMSESRKLRKRTSLVQGVSLPPVSPTRPLSFQPTPRYTDLLPPQPSSFRKPEKTQKKVLSKRRIDV